MSPTPRLRPSWFMLVLAGLGVVALAVYAVVGFWMGLEWLLS